MAGNPGGEFEPALAGRGRSENWGSKIGVILAVAGSAVGLGNFLRFPGQAALNGGGMFMIPYFISMLLLGIPICWVEWTMGRYGGSRGHNSAPGIFSVLWGRWGARYLGVLALIVPVVIYMYYVYIEAWCLRYAIDYANGTMGKLAAGAQPSEEMSRYGEHFGQLIGAGANGLPGHKGLIVLGGVFLLNFYLVYRGVTKGIEVFCKFAMPLLIIIALIILARVLTLPPPAPEERPEATINNALGFMWNPEVKAHFGWQQTAGPEVELSSGKVRNPSFEAPEVTEAKALHFSATAKGGLKEERMEYKVIVLPEGGEAPDTEAVVGRPGEKIQLAIDEAVIKSIEDQPFWTALMDPGLWLAASGQIFFSLSVGFGIILNYASYLRRDDDVALSGLTASATNQFCEVCLGGLIVVPVAFLFLGTAGLNEEVLDSTFQLGFHALPAVFNRMPLGNLFGGLFFFMLFMAAITSSLSMLQPAIAFLEQGFGLGRRASVACLGLIVAMGGLIVIYFSKNALALDTMDFWVGTVCIYILATIQVITVGWVFGVKRAKAEIQRGAELKIPNAFWFVVKYVCPLYLLTIFAGFCIRSLPGKIAAIMDMKKSDRDSVLFVFIFLGLLMIFFTVLVGLAGKRWKQRHKTLEEVSI